MSKSYAVEVREVNSYRVTVQAESVEEARRKVADMLAEVTPEEVGKFMDSETFADYAYEDEREQDAEVNAQVDASIAKNEPPF